MNYIKYIFILFSVGVCSIMQGQQLPYRSVVPAADFQWNPAKTALGENANAGLLYRQQWLGFQNAPVSSFVHFDYPLVYNNMSLGGLLSLDKTGFLQTTQMNLTYSYKIETNLFSKDQLSFGILASIRQMRFDGASVIAHDDEDVLVSGQMGNAWQGNAGVGIFYISNVDILDSYDSGFYLGFGGVQLIRNSVALGDTEIKNYATTPHLNFNGGAQIHADGISIEPSVWLDYAYPNIYLFSLNCTIEIPQTLWGGLSYFSENTVGIQAGFYLLEGKLKAGTMGTYNIFGNGSNQGAGFEVFASYSFEAFD